MKRIIKFSLSLTLLVLCSCTLYSASLYKTTESVLGVSKPTKQQDQFSSNNNLHLNLSLEVRPINILSFHASESFTKTPLSNKARLFQNRSQITLASTLLYIKYQDNILVKHRKCDDIFPFHYFW